MGSETKPQPLDIIVTIIIFAAALAGLYQSMTFPGRAGMWPTFVMVSLLLFVGLHLINLFRKLLQADREPMSDPLSTGEEG